MIKENRTCVELLQSRIDKIRDLLGKYELCAALSFRDDPVGHQVKLIEMAVESRDEAMLHIEALFGVILAEAPTHDEQLMEIRKKEIAAVGKREACDYDRDF